MIGLVPATVLTAFAAETVTGGTTGDCEWTFDDTIGTLTVSVPDTNVTGAMGDYRFVAQRPWNNFIDSITKVVIESGVTSVGNNAFNGCSNLTEVVLPDTVTSIGTRAFYICVAVTNFEYKEIAE